MPKSGVNMEKNSKRTSYEHGYAYYEKLVVDARDQLQRIEDKESLAAVELFEKIERCELAISHLNRRFTFKLIR